LIFPFFFASFAQTLSLPADVGSKACAACHRSIYESYQKTGMARTSGRTGDRKESFERGAFDEYRVTPDYRLTFRKDIARHLEWFVGSGGLGRSYVLSRNGFLFQAPVSYYAAAAKWDVSPGFGLSKRTDFTRPVETGCLQCHASRLQPVAGTLNGFRSPPFLEAGVSCERCHGPGSEHVRSGGKRPMVNPAKLDAVSRDSICAQCHLTGAARLARAGAKAYRPGDALSDSLAVFTWVSRDSAVDATSHYEKLSRSRCLQASGNRLWCGTCHDPHGAATDFNAKCAGCHSRTECTQGPACVTCHMPAADAASMDHVAFTDHSIPRKPGIRPPGARRELASFWKDLASPRDEALAYAVAAQTVADVRPKAFELLVEAAERNPNDITVLAQMAQFYDRMRDEERAASFYTRVLALDANHVAAAVNLGVYLAKQGRAADAIGLWERALSRAPGQSGARINLAVAKARAGDKAGAIAALESALDYDPANEQADALLKQLRHE
jgi:tetratricopeptide (TPR) repeat protein